MRIRARWMVGAVTALGLGTVVSGSLTGGTATAREADAALGYACEFPSGTSHQVAVQVRGTFPASATAGGPVRPGRITATVTVPEAALPEVAALGGASVAGTARLATTVRQNGTSTPVAWDGLTTPATPVAEDADLELAASGDVPPVTPAGAGDLTFTAGELALTLESRDAGGGARKDAKPLAITCTPGEGRDMALATVPVRGGETPGETPAPGASAAPEVGRAPAEAPGGTPPECGTYTGPDATWMPGCVYLSGFSNVAKLDGAAMLNDPEFAEPALTNMIYMITREGASVRQRFVTPLRSTSTFLTFGLMPTTATMEMTQRPLKPGDPDDPQNYGTFEAISDLQTGIQSVSAHMKMSIRIRDVKVKGTPLDVGANCRTATDADLRLKGQMPNILEGGVVDGSFTIPEFRGCGVGEDLDHLFNGSVAGPGNLLRVTLGSTCIPFAEISCPPVLPQPSRNPR
ncbi:DUF6801 domain-containing protein [Actinomadura sp. 7K507]|uniref:DUF6801 domain-containing protein n=1 Tax=Actinomadura sp. 7K507 TaxID=2530365 RepID=UPI00104A97E2|nr:DUF6801 domain-containing protein [Actinomadura sp. 7K507]TDC74937.1 hypothetical protein E1285_42295 [Actinomadura sp. 7K507]